MTPEEFKESVQEIIDPGLPSTYRSPSTWSSDPEVEHSDYDELLERVLRELGYGDGIDLAKDQTRRFA